LPLSQQGTPVKNSVLLRAYA